VDEENLLYILSSGNHCTAEQDVASWQILALQEERQEFHASSSLCDMFLADFPNKMEDNLVHEKHNKLTTIADYFS